MVCDRCAADADTADSRTRMPLAWRPVVASPMLTLSRGTSHLIIASRWTRKPLLVPAADVVVILEPHEDLDAYDHRAVYYLDSQRRERFDVLHFRRPAFTRWRVGPPRWLPLGAPYRGRQDLVRMPFPPWRPWRVDGVVVDLDSVPAEGVREAVVSVRSWADLVGE